MTTLPILAHVHIPKTGGSTLRGLLRRNFGFAHFDVQLLPGNQIPEAGRLKRILLLYPTLASIAGHDVRPRHEIDAAFPDVRYFTFLRQPVSRVISALRFDAFFRAKRENWTPRSAEQIRTFAHTQLAERSNEMCRHLSPDGNLEEAIRTLRTAIGFVGLVEEFDTSLYMLGGWIGSDLDLRYSRQNTAASVASGLRNPDVASRIAGFFDDFRANPAELTHVAEMNVADQALYDYARREIFSEELATHRKCLPSHSQAKLETPRMPRDDPAAHLFRVAVARPLIPILIRAPIRP